MNDRAKILYNKFINTVVNIITMLFSIFCVFPFVWMFYSSFKTEAEFAQNIISLPKSPQFDNYLKAIRTGK